MDGTKPVFLGLRLDLRSMDLGFNEHIDDSARRLGFGLRILRLMKD
jgi:hypothetical protein